MSIRSDGQWCIAKNIGGYTLETRRRGDSVLGEGVSPSQPTRGPGGASWAPPAGSGAEPRPPTHSRHISGPQKPSSRIETMHYGVYGIVQCKKTGTISNLSWVRETKQPHKKFKVDWFGGYIYRYTPHRYAPGAFVCVYVHFSRLFRVVSNSASDCLETGKTPLRNDLLCVERDVKLYSLTHSRVIVNITAASDLHLSEQKCTDIKVHTDCTSTVLGLYSAVVSADRPGYTLNDSTVLARLALTITYQTKWPPSLFSDPAKQRS